ncbi:hypothetical protein BC831DRAFT_469497 [Entophlyctis helioformis]|nr:hypothetical protein BC831DRAFT_469497 [Entophlyctis helioformis]
MSTRLVKFRGSRQLQVELLDEAAAHGRLGAVQSLAELGMRKCTTDAMDRAATAGHLPVVEWLHAHRPEGCTPAAMSGAARNGHLAVVQWLHRHRPDSWSPTALREAARSGRRSLVAWLLKHLKVVHDLDAETFEILGKDKIVGRDSLDSGGDDDGDGDGDADDNAAAGTEDERHIADMLIEVLDAANRKALLRNACLHGYDYARQILAGNDGFCEANALRIVKTRRGFCRLVELDGAHVDSADEQHNDDDDYYE